MRIITARTTIPAALGFLYLAWINAPHRIYIMLADDGILTDPTLVEIRVLRYGLFLVSMSIALGTLMWKLGKNATWRLAVEQDYQSFLNQNSAPPANHRRFILACSALLLAVFLCLLQTIHWSFSYDNQGVRWYNVIVRESGIWETLTAVNLLAASLMLIASGLKFRKSFHIHASFVVSLLLGALFVFAFGEEINWGQHYLRFDTPEVIKTLNVQGEFNVHNLGNYWANNAMMVFFFCYVGLLPLLSYGFQDVRYLVDRLAIPLPPLFFVPYGFIGPLLDGHKSFNWIWGSPPWRLSEAREALFSFVMLCIATHIFLQWRQRFVTAEIVDNKE